jgi:hypothetical protein
MKCVVLANQNFILTTTHALKDLTGIKTSIFNSAKRITDNN